MAVWANNIPEWVLLEFGAALAGLTLVTVNPANRAAELGHVLEHSGADGLFLVDEYRGNPMAATVAKLRDRLPRLRETVSFADWERFCAPGDSGRPLPVVDPDDPAQILYTSGTTGRPKGAILHHRGLTNNARFAQLALGARAGDVGVNPMPLFHVAGGGMFTLGTVQSLSTHVLMPHFDPTLQLELTETYRGVVFGGVPTMLLAMLAHPDFARRDLSSVRYGLSGGAPVAPDLVRRIETGLGIPFAITFAQTEASCSITFIRPAEDGPDDRAETLGRPLPQTEVKVADPGTGEIVPPGTTGEICARGYLVMTGYLDDPQATAATIDADGWLHTGDLGSMDERGYCSIGGRVKEMIIRGGENIYPAEVEAALLTHAGIADAAVVGVHDERWGEQVVAFLRAAGEDRPTEAELEAHCRGRLADFKRPRRWAFVEAFPLTGTGKVRKHVLRERLEAGELDEPLADAALGR